MKRILMIGMIVSLNTLPAFATQDEDVQFNANRACAEAVGIPYASDNFTDKEWKDFLKCMRLMKYFDSRY